MAGEGSLTLDHVALLSPDLDASKEDYERLGFRLIRPSAHRGRLTPDGPMEPWGSGNRCAMFRQSTRRLGFEPGNGLQVLVRARVGLYEPRGEYQLVVEHMEPAGAGALRQRFEALKAKLAAEGLFDPERKRPLPRVPQRIGVITSPTGAALRDVLIALRRRFPAVEVLIYPTSVQGEKAATEIVAALARASERSAAARACCTAAARAPYPAALAAPGRRRACRRRRAPRSASRRHGPSPSVLPPPSVRSFRRVFGPDRPMDGRHIVILRHICKRRRVSCGAGIIGRHGQA